MNKLTRQDLLSLERYAAERPAFRARVLAHKKDRQVALGPNATLYFEDRLTVQYQIQEMLRIERLFEAQEVEGELAAYNPLIPDGSNWKATFMLEFPEVEARRAALATLIGIEDRVWVQVVGHDKVYAIADEDLERETAEKTSSVHFLRFELTSPMTAAVRDGVGLAMGIDHPAYQQRVALAAETRAALAADLE
jgi:hypothetical protein